MSKCSCLCVCYVSVCVCMLAMGMSVFMYVRGFIFLKTEGINEFLCLRGKCITLGEVVLHTLFLITTNNECDHFVIYSDFIYQDWSVKKFWMRSQNRTAFGLTTLRIRISSLVITFIVMDGFYKYQLLHVLLSVFLPNIWYFFNKYLM